MYNKEVVQKRSRSYRLRNQKFLAELKARVGCILCKEKHPGCLDFHHRDPHQKVRKFSNLAKRQASLETLKREIAKCDVICANCHRKKHWKDSNIGF